MVVHNVSAFTVREIENQNQLLRFRTAQIGASGTLSGVNVSLTFHASGFQNQTLLKQILIMGNGDTPSDYRLELYNTSSCVSSEIQYLVSSITGLRHIESLNNYPLIDIDGTECLHGKLTQQTSASVYLNYIELRFDRMLP